MEYYKRGYPEKSKEFLKSKNKMAEIFKIAIEKLEDKEISHKEEQERRGRRGGTKEGNCRQNIIILEDRPRRSDI